MQIDEEKMDDAVLAILHLTQYEDHGTVRSWKTLDWNALERLHTKGFISNPQPKAKSVVLSEDGARRSKELFEQLFKKVG